MPRLRALAVGESTYGMTELGHTLAPPKRLTGALRLLQSSIAAGAALILGCQSERLNVTVPVVQPPLVQAGARRGVPVQRIRAGRAIYLLQCARCHAPEPVARYSAEDWASILPGMARKTRLTAQEESDLTAYVNAVMDTVTNTPAIGRSNGFP
jgi:hypothetical protein